MASQACCICSSLLDTYDPATEKAIVPERHLGCCNRIICTRCIDQNARYETYCPYCQISTTPNALPQGLRDPPTYDSLDHRIGGGARSDEKEQPNHQQTHDLDPPAYSVSHAPVARVGARAEADDEKRADTPAQDVLHFLTPDDSLASLALAYGVPIAALRRSNNIFADHLVQGRKTVLIPGEFYKGGVSLSPQPLEGEEEEGRRNKVRRWMVACKVAE